MTHRPAPVLALVAVVALLAGLSGCSLAQLGTSPRPGDAPTGLAPGPTPSATPPKPPKAEPGPRREAEPALRAKATAPFGTLVTDSKGFTLYRSERDGTRPPRSRCAGACLKTWWPATIERPDRIRVAGIDPDLVGTLRRKDGRFQLTLAGRPLYRFAGDKLPGDAKGQCRDNVFFAVTPEGGRNPMRVSAA